VRDVVRSSCIDIVNWRDHDVRLTLSEGSAPMKQDLVRDERMHVTSFCCTSHRATRLPLRGLTVHRQ
jgi:hypothetical protein